VTVADTKTAASGVRRARAALAQVVWLLAVACALVLAVGALLVALDANPDNALVRFVLDLADAVDLDVFSRGRDGIFTFRGGDPAKGALANWGLGAVAYLVVGRVLERLIRP
jgi:hypothetical protein